MSQKQNDRLVGTIVSSFVGLILLFILAMAFIPMPITYSELAAQTPFTSKLAGLVFWGVAAYLIYGMNVSKWNNSIGLLFLTFLFFALGTWAFIGFQI